MGEMESRIARGDIEAEKLEAINVSSFSSLVESGFDYVFPYTA